MNNIILGILEQLEKDLDQISPELRGWNKNYFLYHKNRYMSDLTIFDDYYNGGTILEIGSIPCHLTYCLKSLKYPVIGIDINPERASTFIKKNDLDIRKCDIEHETIPFEDNFFDLILFLEMFEHLRIDPISTLKEIYRILKPGGIIFLETTNLYSLRNILKFNLGRGINDGYEEFNKLHTIGHMGHVREYSTREMKKFLIRTGLKIIDMKYVMINSGQRKSFFRKGVKSLFSVFGSFIPKIRTHQIFICQK